MRIKKALIMINQMKSVFILLILISFCLSYSQIEIDSGQHAKVLKPSGGETYKVGDTVHIQFLADSTFGFGGYTIMISVDSGKTFGVNFINPDIYYFQRFDPDFKNIPWVIPETLTVGYGNRLKKVSMVSDKAVLRLDDVFNSINEGFKYNSGVFSIVQKTAIEIDSGKHIKILEPSGGESFKVGDTVHIKLLADNTVMVYSIKISVDGGKTFGQNFLSHYAATIQDTSRYYQPGEPDFKNVSWIIPDTLTYLDLHGHLNKIFMVSNQVVLQLDDFYNYRNECFRYNSGIFSIIPNDASRIEGKIQPDLQARFNVRIKGDILFSSSPVALVKVVDIMGRMVASFAGSDGLTIDIKSNLKSGIAAGVYKISVLSVNGENSVINWIFVR